MKVRHHHSTKRKRQLRVRGKLFGTATRPRITVYRSNKHIFVQAVDDNAQRTIVSAHDKQVGSARQLTKTEKSTLVGQLLGQRLKAKKIKLAVFDRGSYRYHGRVKAVAEALRKEGIQL